MTIPAICKESGQTVFLTFPMECGSPSDILRQFKGEFLPYFPHINSAFHDNSLGSLFAREIAVSVMAKDVAKETTNIEAVRGTTSIKSTTILEDYATSRQSVYEHLGQPHQNA